MLPTNLPHTAHFPVLGVAFVGKACGLVASGGIWATDFCFRGTVSGGREIGFGPVGRVVAGTTSGVRAIDFDPV